MLHKLLFPILLLSVAVTQGFLILTEWDVNHFVKLISSASQEEIDQVRGVPAMLDNEDNKEDRVAHQRKKRQVCH
jgi:hypothetical protein